MTVKPHQIEAIRQFSRFYTTQIEALGDAYLQSPFNVTEARVIFELAHNKTITAQALSRILKLNAGYLSRKLKSFEEEGLITRTSSELDRRSRVLTLTDKGYAAFDLLNLGSVQQISNILEPLRPHERGELVAALEKAQQLIEGTEKPANVSYILRQHEPGDMGWIVQAHGALYAKEYGWDETFEAMVAEVAAEFLKSYDHRCERCWIAEVDGEIVGSAMVVRQSPDLAKLRLVIVDPKARGLGIGKRLTEEAIRFAQSRKYRVLTLWTNANLIAARAIYEKAGFQLVKSEAYHGFGHDLVGENWDLDLGS